MISSRHWPSDFRLGASALALAACTATPSFAQAEIQPIAPDATQSAAPNQDVGEPAADQASGDVIVVTGRRAALEAADQRKRRSETIIDSVVADDAGRLPDNSITEVLQRVSGVSIVRFSALNNPDHFSVQGTGVQVRGLTGVASRLNGREIFSANNGRAILWSDVTPELMSAVDVYKASTADLIEGGTGGQIDLRTKMPFDFDGKLHAAGTAELSMGDLSQKSDYAGSLLLTDSFDTGIGRIGVLVDVATSQFSSLSQFIRVEPYYRTKINDTDYQIPGGFNYGEEEFQYKRGGIFGAVQWAPSDALTFSATFFQSRYKTRSGDYGAQVASQTLAVDPSVSKFDDYKALISTPSLFNRDPATFLPSGVVNSGGQKGIVRANTLTRDYSLSFAWAPDDSPLAVRGAIQQVDSQSISNSLDVFREISFGPGFGLDLSGDLPVVSVSPTVQTGFDNLANYFWAASMPHSENNTGRLRSAQLDAEYKFDDSFLKSIKVGGRFAERTERDFNNGYNWVALGRGWNGDPQMTFANAAPGDVELHTFKDFFRGAIPLPGNLFFASESLVSRLDRVQLHTPPPAGFCAGAEFNCSASGPVPTTGYGNLDEIRPVGFVLPDDRVDNRTRNTAAYALVRFGSREGRGIAGNAGLRVVNVRNEGEGFVRQNASTFIRDGQTLTLGNNAVPRSGKGDFTRFLPSINLEFSPSEKLKLRAGYNVTMDLPSFNALRASGTVSVATTTNPASTPENNLPGIFTNFIAETGNPSLKPTMSNNFDVSLEYYARPGTMFHLAPFYKRITNQPIYSLTQREVTVVLADGTSETLSAQATDYINSSEAATVKGVEVGGRAFLDMLPGLLSGFGVEANYTFIDSTNPGDVYRDIAGALANDAPLVGLSRHNVNATLLYERKAISARVAYSWRSRYLQTTNANGTNQNYAYYSAPGVLTNLDTDNNPNTQIALPVYGDAYGTLDAGIRFKVTRDFSFGIQGTNLLNATQRTLMGGYPGGKIYTRSWFQSDRRINVGISLAF